ncbi:hypothetical protein GWI33_001453 [Rhynchophorus ferrugineus]|uniref:Uncharacterized protein n=1 Tax=Rhynchophorus ferrugineus TaxID=354439 RepID=A0A834MNG7_RHYFE|nr:hypothetical protein GWI33_001453 [Rhynchophorus ferrugineus]
MHTTITSHTVPSTGEIIVTEVKVPHHLFIGRCTKQYPLLHQENIDIRNDGKSLISADIRINVEGNVTIMCANIYDRNKEAQAYLSYIAGGVGYNFIEFNVNTSFGNGIKFFVEIFGKYLE